MNKHIKSLRFVLVAIIFAFVGGFWIRQSTHAASGQIYLSPSSASVQIGNNVTVAFRVTGTALYGAEGTIHYDTNKLQLVGQDVSGSAFTVTLPPAAASAGTVSFARGNLGTSVSGDVLIATMTFKALTGSGTTPLTLSPANAGNANGYVDPTISNATVSLTPVPTTPAPTPSPSPTPSTKPSPTPASGGSSAANPSPTPTPAGASPPTAATTSANAAAGITLGDVKVQFTQAIISIKTATPSQVYIKYGVNGELTLNTPLSESSTEHTVSLDPKLLVPGEVYSYTVVTKDSNGTIKQGAVQTLKTKGFTLKLVVRGKDGKPFRNQKVTLHSDPVDGKTNDDGIVTFTDVALGNHKLETTISGKSYSQALSVKNNIVTEGGAQSAATQIATVSYGANKSNTMLILIGGIVVVLVLIVLVIIIVRKKKNDDNKFPPSYGAGDPDASQTLPPTNSMPIGYSDPSYTGQSVMPSAPQQLAPPSGPVVGGGGSASPYPNDVSPQPGSTYAPSPNSKNEGGL
ncbi:MAG TPA: cohesin domain-containing protein [Patescibacteria group bacterium]|nr:cohesin domain-containing protein [Patescibacteria group bacterium]